MAGCGHSASDHERRLIEAMMPKTPEDHFWRSPDGTSRYDELLDAHYVRLIETVQHSGLRVFPNPTCDVLVLENVAGDDEFLAITKGLSGFILGPPCHSAERTCLRHEFAWAFKDESAIEGVVSFMRELADHVLAGRRWFFTGDVIRGVDFAKYMGKACTPTAISFTNGWYLTEQSQALVANHFEGRIMEVYGITDGEADWLERDEEGFYDACEASDVDFNDMQRTPLQAP
jgi:hypothetical protein